MTTLKPGDIAPDFTTIDEENNTINLKDFRGTKVILFAYPKANTPGCTAEACNLQSNYELLASKGFKIIGISVDDAKKQQNFKTKFGFKYPLIPDVEKSILKAYGIWGLKKNYGKEYEGIMRTTFIIDENGIIEKVFKKVDTKNHAEQILKEY